MSITESEAWKALEAHRDALGHLELKKLFAEDPKRFDKFHVQWNDILLDYSKNWVTEETLKLLAALLPQADVAGWAKRMFAGVPINSTERRAVLHVALRNRSNAPILVDGKDVMPEVRVFGLLLECVAWRKLHLLGLTLGTLPGLLLGLLE